MTKQTFENKVNWDEYGIGYTNVYVPIFGIGLAFEFFPEDGKEPKVSDKMFEAVQDVLNLPDDSLEKIKELLWEECHFSFAVSDYGCEAESGETVAEAHFRQFELHSKEDAYKRSKMERIQIHFENDALQGQYAEIKCETATDNLISVIFKNGQVIGYDDGTYLGWFETDEQYARHKRTKTLNG